ncbi:unnamed protein product [Heterobilharzia americana]|nr:unnamed protein product [Heterobilharzia americana]
MLSNSNNEEGGSDRLLIKTKVYYTYLSGLLLPFILMGIFTILLSSMFFIHNNTITVYASFIFLVIVRGLLYSPCISFLLIAFPVRYFGTLNGITSILTGLFSLLQHTLIYVDVSIINIISLIISICIFIPCIVLFKLKG